MKWLTAHWIRSRTHARWFDKDGSLVQTFFLLIRKEISINFWHLLFGPFKGKYFTGFFRRHCDSDERCCASQGGIAAGCDVGRSRKNPHVRRNPYFFQTFTV